ncbi:TetR/AcrR family transcriptional regulator [Haliea sp. E1-2-M8]|uniref:TetR/AcrR family transcriptional regulator n=1 Tax=Haliea sp. E1-2-M8 TaxID=3064706 RepID=UPI0027185431|nr:TetR/AcrR family transcriptional regulator [Haliea sp. E1-2-M8]MDO8861998.1 TetR/AcrR family transcriptional regulator [Haliea sp. E1-2-M8]
MADSIACLKLISSHFIFQMFFQFFLESIPAVSWTIIQVRFILLESTSNQIGAGVATNTKKGRRASRDNNRAGSGTRDKLVATALDLFTRQGYAETSLSEITRTAGANIAAVNYHFGSKEDLYLAALDHQFLPILEARKQRLAAIEAQARDNNGQWDVVALLESWLDPVIEAYSDTSGGGRITLGLEIQVVSSIARGEIAKWPKPYREYKARFNIALVRAIQYLPTETVVWRSQILTSSLLTMLTETAADDSLGLDISGNLDTLRTQWLAAGLALLEVKSD